MAACFIKYITNQNLSKTKLKLYLQTKNANMSHRTMNLIEHFARSKDKCILTDSLFYDTIMYSGFSKELVCENAFFFLMVTSGKAKVYTRHTRDYTCHIGKNDLLVIPASMTATFQQLSEDYAMHCLVFTPPFFYSLPSSQFLYGKLCEFVTRYSFATIHLKNDAGTYFKKTFSLFRGYRTGELLHQEGIYGHLCNFFILNVGDVFFSSIEDASPAISNKSWIYYKFKELLFEHYRRQHKIRFYAERLSVSGIYLSRIVKEETGETIHGHITRLLYVEAKKMLSCSKNDIQKITDALGFTDQASFSKFFKRFAGVSPTEYRNNIKNNKNSCLEKYPK